MASIKSSLRKIYSALGGTNSKSKTITGLLDEISTVASGGGGGGSSSGVKKIKLEWIDDGDDMFYNIETATYNDALQTLKSGGEVLFYNDTRYDGKTLLYRVESYDSNYMVISSIWQDSTSARIMLSICVSAAHGRFDSFDKQI